MKAKERIGKGRWGWGTRGRKTGLSETDCSLQRADIKLGKCHYQMLNMVAAVRYWMQTVCFCFTWCNTLFSAISSGCKANEEPSLIGWIPKQITSPQLSGTGLPGDWLQARAPGFALVWLITSRLSTPVCCCDMHARVALWGIYSILDYQNRNYLALSIGCHPPLPPSTNIHHRLMLMSDNTLEIRDF